MTKSTGEMLEFWLTSCGQNVAEKQRREVSNYDYDMVVIGSGPAGHHAAIRAAKLGKKVVTAERNGEYRPEKA